MCTLVFYLRPLKERDGRPSGSLCVRFIHHRKALSLGLGFHLYEEEWDSLNQCIVYPVVSGTRSAYLERAELAIENCWGLSLRIIRGLEEQGGYTVGDIAGTYRSHTTPGNLSVYCERQTLILKKSNRERTARAYLSAVRSLTAFNKDRPLALAAINSFLIKDYERYLRDRGKSLNTISFYMRNLRALYNKAIADNIIPAPHKKPFLGVYTGMDNTRKRALGLEDIGKMRQVVVKSERLECCRQLFFFCFYARGMSFIDLAYLRKDNIGKGVISYYHKKTGQLIEIKLTGDMQEIIDSFSVEMKFSPYVFPILRDRQKPLRLQYESALRGYNRDLKEVARLSGISCAISSHVARHSWATIAKYERLPLSVISEGLGHSNEKTTYIYLASFERSRLDEANEMIGHAIERACASPLQFHLSP